MNVVHIILEAIGAIVVVTGILLLISFFIPKKPYPEPILGRRMDDDFEENEDDYVRH